MHDLSRLAIHTQTNKPWSLRECCERYARIGAAGVSVWREPLQAVGLDEAARIVRGSGLAVPALVRGGFFVSADPARRAAALDENRRAIDEAAAIGADMVVLVVGAEPGVPLESARALVAEGVAGLLDHAAAASVRLAVEPLHPMYAGDKSCINRMAEARELCERVESPLLGVAVDVYHVWWDPDLEAEIALAGRTGRLFAFHVCDWRVPTRDLLLDRAIMGEGCIDIPRIRSWVEAAGFGGPIEVEIFSQDHWAEDQTRYLERIRDAYLAHV